MNTYAPTLISLVLPAFNEGSIIQHTLAVISGQIETLPYVFEVIVVDDGSTDNTSELVNALRSEDDRIKLLSLTRNFGKEAAIYAGLEHCNGDCAVVIDADLQHPPALIGQMLEEWNEGAFVVEATKTARGDESLQHSLAARAFYATYRWLSGLNINNQTDFKLLDRTVINAYLAMPERYRFFRGLVHWLGVGESYVTFEVENRAQGHSRWNRASLLKYGINNITSFSTAPLWIVGGFGFASVAIGVVFSIIALYQKFAGQAADGFTTVIILTLMLGGMIMLSLGIIGHYIGRIYNELKARPIYVIKPQRKLSSQNQH